MEKSQAVSMYHKQWTGLSLSLGHVKVKTVRKGIKKANVEVGNQPKLRGLLTREMIKELEG